MWKTASPSFRAFARGGICTLMIGMDFPPSSPLPEPEKRTTVQVERENREKGGASAVTTRQLCNFPSSFTDYATDAAAAKQKRVRLRRVRPSVQIELKLAGSFSLSVRLLKELQSLLLLPICACSYTALLTYEINKVCQSPALI